MSTPAPNWYVLTLAGKTIGGYATLAQAQAAATAHGPGTYTITAQVKTTTTVGTSTFVVPNTPPAGVGLKVSGAKLLQPDATEFRVRGGNRCHYDSNSMEGLVKAGPNTVRIFVSTAFGDNWAQMADICQTQHVANDQIVVPVIPTLAGGSSTVKISGSQNPADVAAAYAQWVSQAPLFAPMLNKAGMLNPANEWGPADSTVWRDAHISGIAKLRAANYTCPVLVDSGGFGQDPLDILNYGAAVLAADPLKNVAFSYHDYSPPSSLSYFPQFAASGLCVIVGEFGPSSPPLVGGPSPTTLTPEQIIQAAEANNLGWMAWAWDDNNLAGGASNDNWFSMTYHGPGIYTQASDLTNYGQIIVPVWQQLAKKSTIFA